MIYAKQVLDTILDANIPARWAYPAGQMPALTEPVAAVELEKVDYEAGKTVVLAKMLCPRALGGLLCQSKAEQASAMLHMSGFSCVQGECGFDKVWDCYFVPIWVTFTEPEKPVSDLKVMLDGKELKNLVSFTVWREEDPDNGVAMKDMPWAFRAEEIFTAGTEEVKDYEEGFTLTVIRTAATESFENCTWTSQRRENTGTQLRQILTGTAAARKIFT